jgi:hypothetical protein
VGVRERRAGDGRARQPAYQERLRALGGAAERDMRIVEGAE